MITDPIKFNVKERGRKFRGQDRNFDTVALAKLINGGAVQEQVKHGDLGGYFGHWPRLLFGLAPVEGGVVDGKVVSVPFATRTVEVSADNDGNITHRQEFLDTESGKIAECHYKSKQGGFSSVIKPMPGTSPTVAAGFYGFDYVFEPNYTTNRGHQVLLDGVMDGDLAGMDAMMVLDYAVGELTQSAGLIGTMFDNVHSQLMMALAALDRTKAENEELISMIAGGKAVLDSVGCMEAIGPLRTGQLPDFERYRSVSLEQLAVLDSAKDEPPSPMIAALRRRFGLRGTT